MIDHPDPNDMPTSGPPPTGPDDLMDSREPFDPGQWAMHGLLSTFVDHANQDRTRHVQAIMDRIARETESVAPSGGLPRDREDLRLDSPHSFLRQPRLHRIAVAALVAVVCVLFGLWLLWSSGGNDRAIAMDLREVGFAPPLPAAGLWSEPLDDAAYREAELTVAEARVELRKALAINDRAKHDPWPAWTRLYRNLRAMGKWEEALAEAQAFVAYAKRQNAMPDRYSPYYWSLNDLGDMYQALGDYENALACHREALHAGRDYHEWFHRTGRSGDRRPHALESALACALAPRLWKLSTLAAAQGDQRTAWDYHEQAGQLLTDFFQKDCAFRGLTVPPDATLFDLCMAVAPVGDRHFKTPAVLVRQHLLHEAMLLRIDRKPEAAAETIERLQAIPDYPRADDFRQDFRIPMEELRIAVARGDYAAALSAADEAEQHTDMRYREGYPFQGPIGTLARAELRFLRGVALAGLDPKDPDALGMIESAIEVVEQSAASLPETQREQLLQRFANWNKTANWIRQQ